MLKKTVTIILAAVLICSMAACGTSQSTEPSVLNTYTSVSKAEGYSENKDSKIPVQESLPESNTEQSEESVKAESSEDITESSADTYYEKTKKTDLSAVSGSSENSSSEKSLHRQSESSTAVKDETVYSVPDTENNTDTETTADTSEQTSAVFNQNEENTVSENSNSNTSSVSKSTQQKTTVSYQGNTSGKIDTTDLFTDRDLTQSPDLSSAKTITVSDSQTINITEEGIYVIKGTASNCTIRVEADKQAKVQLVLDGVSITNDNFPTIYVVSADKCFVTTTDSTNTLSVTGTFTSDGTTNTDAVIFSKDDLVLNGVGTLNINSSAGNGISGKDDIKITGGTYNITSAEDSIEANDSISVYDGSFTIRTSKDGLHSENDDDDTVGWIYICGGSFNITASSDAIQATTVTQIDGGTFNLTASEGIEATYIQINDGTINISASDDGINAAQKSKSYSTPTIEINGGNLTVVMGQGDTDAVDSNGNIIVNGGTIDITAQMSSFDYDGTAQYNGGTIIINGTQVNSIPQSMMGGRGGMMNGMNGMNGRFRQ